MGWRRTNGGFPTRLDLAGCARRLSGLGLLVSLLAAAALAVPGNALAAGCGAYPVCPYGQLTTLGGSDPASLSGPLAVAQTPSGDAVIIDAEKSTVREFDPQGNLVTDVGSTTAFAGPRAVAVDPSSGEIYVADRYCVRWFHPDGTLDSPSYCPTGQNAFWPSALTVGSDGTLYVANEFGGDVLEFSPGGTLLRDLPMPAGTDTTADSLGVDSAGNLYWIPGASCDGCGDTVYRMSATGTQLPSLNLPVAPSVIQVYGSTLWAASGTGSSSELSAYDLAGDPQGSPIALPDLGSTDFDHYGMSPDFSVGAAGILAETTGHSIVHLSSDGTPILTWGSLAPDDDDVFSLMSEADGALDVLDAENGRVIQYPAGGGPPTVLSDLHTVLAMDAGAMTGAEEPDGDLLVQQDGTVVTLDPAGNQLAVTKLTCSNGCGEIAAGPDGEIDVDDFDTIDVFSSGGQLLSKLAISTDDFTTDSAGDIYAMGATHVGTIDKYSPSGTLLQTIDEGQNGELVGPGPIAVDAAGEIVTGDMDEVRVFSPAGTEVATWPETEADSDSSADALTVSPNGSSIYVAHHLSLDDAASTIARYSDLRSPFPSLPFATAPPPTATAPTRAAAVAPTLGVTAPRQLATRAITTTLSCPRSVAQGCTGTLEIRTTHATGTSTQPILGHRSFHLRAGRRARLDVPLDAEARRLLRRHRTLPAELIATSVRGAARKSFTRRFTVHRG